MGSVRTSIIGRPRPLPGPTRRTAPYTLICDEPLKRVWQSNLVRIAASSNWSRKFTQIAWGLVEVSLGVAALRPCPGNAFLFVDCRDSALDRLRLRTKYQLQGVGQHLRSVEHVLDGHSP